MQIEERGIICDTAKRPPSERIAFFTSLCTTNSGAILCAFQLGAAKHAINSTILVCRSTDQGRSWTELPARIETRYQGVPGSMGAGEMVEVSPGKLLLICTWYDRSEPDRPTFDPVTGGLLRSKQLAAFSSDGGESWSAWRELSINGLKGGATTGPMVKWPDGTIAYAFESYKEFDDPNPGIHAAWLIASTDAGKSFGKPLLVAQHPEHKVFYWDQRLCIGRQNGEFIALFWTHDLEHKKDLNVHMMKGTLSENGIKSGPIVKTPIIGQIAAPILLDDGRLLAFVIDRGQPCTMKLWGSKDGGTNWSEQLLVYNHSEHGALTQGKENIDYMAYWDDMGKWTFGHPAVRPLNDGRILLAYYAGVPNCLSIYWVRVKVD